MSDSYMLEFDLALSIHQSTIEYNYVQTLQKPSDETIIRVSLVCIRMQKDHMRTLKILWSTSEFCDHGNTKITQHALKVSESSEG